MNLKAQRTINYIVAMVIAIFMVIFLIFPPFWMVLTSFKPEKDMFIIPPTWFFKPTFENYLAVLSRPEMGKIFLNTTLVSIVASIFTLIIGAMAAYSIARFKTGGKPALYSTLVLRVLPPVVLGLPLFILFSRLKLVDTLSGLVIAYVAFLLPNTIWLLIAFFSEIPFEIEESALVDGCSRFGTFIRIVIPLALPGFVVTGIYNFMGAWNHFFFGLILSSTNARTLPVEASNFVGEYSIQWGEVSAIGSILIILPVLVTFVLQKYLVKGLTLGAVKG